MNVRRFPLRRHEDDRGWFAEILAQQHAIVLRRLLEPIGIPVGLATGSLSARAKEEVRREMREGRWSLVVGTHALIQEGVEFDRLGLIVIDEQHRFGVLPRQALNRNGQTPHVLEKALSWHARYKREGTMLVK